MAHPYPQAMEFVHVVESRPLDCRSCHFHRVQLRHGRQFARAAHLPSDAQHLGGGLDGGVLVGDGPARCAIRTTQLLLQEEILDFDDHTIGIKGKAQARFSLLMDESE